MRNFRYATVALAIGHAWDPGVLIETKFPAKKSAPTRERRAPQRWHAVGITGTSKACAAALACKGKRYLSGDAPHLPLAECDAARCECKYRHFEDRRGASRRQGDPPPMREATNRRGNRGRRATD
jgi:hypothetical protein